VSVDETSDPVLMVDTLTDEDDGDFSAGDLSLREAISRANESDLFNLIEFNLPAGGTIALTQGELVISEAVTITGPGSERLTIDAAGNSRIFHLTRGSTNIRGLTLANGVTGGSGGAILLSSSSGTFEDLVVRDSQARLGGGIAVEQAVLTLSNSSILRNTAVGGGGGIHANAASGVSLSDSTLEGNQADPATGLGGGLFAEDFASVRQSTVADNEAAVGGGIHVVQLQMENSTISGNQASFNAAGLLTRAGTISSSTIVLNRAGLDPSATNGIGGLDANNTLILHRSIVAGNQFGAGGLPSDLANAIPASSLNLIGDADSAGGLLDGRNGNLVGRQGTGVRPLETIVKPILADNGGATPTHALASDSPAIDFPVSYAADVIDSSPLAYFQFNGAATDAVADATIRGAAFLQPFGFPDIPGFSPSLVLLEGSQTFVETDLSLNGFDQFTIEAWINPAAAQGNRTGIAGQNDLIELGFIDARTLQLFTAAEGPLNVVYDSVANANEWLYVVAVGTGSQRRIYLNGELAAEAAHPIVGPGGYGQSSDPFRFGGGGIFDASGNFFNGRMDEVAVYASALTSSQIQRRFALTLSNFPANDQAGNARPLGSGIDLGAMEFAPTVGPVNGDVNQDGASNAADIDLMCRSLTSGDLFFDLNSDGQVNFADVEFLVENELSSVFGDSNLDGRFDSSDLVTVFIEGQFEDGILNNSGWQQGDWNCDGEFSTADLVFVFTKGTFIRAAIAAPDVPSALGSLHAMAVDVLQDGIGFPNELNSGTANHETPRDNDAAVKADRPTDLPAAIVDHLFEQDKEADWEFALVASDNRIEEI
jgi:hypothetical protein